MRHLLIINISFDHTYVLSYIQAGDGMTQGHLLNIVLKAPRLSSPETMLTSMHWLPVVYRIQYKLVLFLSKLWLQGNQFISRTCSIVVAVRNTRSSTLDSLVVPSIRTKMAWRAFSHAAPTIWNNLSHNVRETTSINSFRTRLKTFYFKLAYWTINRMFPSLWVPGCTDT